MLRNRHNESIDIRDTPKKSRGLPPVVKLGLVLGMVIGIVLVGLHSCRGEKEIKSVSDTPNVHYERLNPKGL
ncbi:MAG: hypothetical protein H7832_10400 [Magnetococcus sp. DMHC-6]